MKKNELSYQICSRCIMDSSDPEITFDDQGVCNHCHHVDTVLRPRWFPNEEGAKKLDALAKRLKKAGKGKAYDCIIGLSGGVDSSYLAYLAVKHMGLRPLAVHVDAGWNSDEAVSNIHRLTDILGIHLVTYVVNWEEMKSLHRAFLASGVANQDIPQDHAFTAGVFKTARQYGIKTILGGSNFATESILPNAWGYDAMDRVQLMDIYKKYAPRPRRRLKSYPTLSFLDYYLFFPYIHRVRIERPLNYIPYSKTEAMQVLKNELEWQYYGGKHHESRFTKFFQSYYLPTKWGYDKRRAHLASMIHNEEVTREAALAEMQRPSYDEETIPQDKVFIAKKLGISTDELETLIQCPNRQPTEYKSHAARKALLLKTVRAMRPVVARLRRQKATG